MMGWYHIVIQRPNALTRIYDVISFLLQLFQISISSLSLSTCYQTMKGDLIYILTEDQDVVCEVYNRYGRSPSPSIGGPVRVWVVTRLATLMQQKCQSILKWKTASRVKWNRGRACSLINALGLQRRKYMRQYTGIATIHQARTLP